MKIVISSVNGVVTTTFEVVGTDTDSENFILLNRRKVQIVEGLRWEEVDVYSRKNRTTEISCRVYKIHASLIVADRYLTEIETKIPLRGDVKVYTGANDSICRWLKNACIDSVENTRKGVTTFHTFHIIGGRLRLSLQDNV